MFTYRAFHQIGAGGFGRVFSGMQVETGGRVAIKFLHSKNPDHVIRFRREARILGQMNSPNIVRLIDMNFQRQDPFIVLEYCDQGSLQQWVADLQEASTVVAVLSWISGAVAELHSRGGFHRDIKPTNILLMKGKDGKLIPKLADFGLARTLNTIGPNVTRNGYGTIGYIAPELESGSDFDWRCDVYSLGITATELLVGDKDPLKLFNFRVPAALRDLVLAMRSKEPHLRPNAETITTNLRRIYQTIIHEERRRRDDGFKSVLALGALIGGGYLLAKALNGRA
jgi:serine/threonine protein kinase